MIRRYFLSQLCCDFYCFTVVFVHFFIYVNIVVTPMHSLTRAFVDTVVIKVHGDYTMKTIVQFYNVPVGEIVSPWPEDIGK